MKNKRTGLRVVFSVMIVAAWVALGLMTGTRLVSANTFTVTNLNDSGSGSLRQAVIDAAAGDTIDFSVTGTITLTTGELLIDKNLIVSGPGAASLTIRGSYSAVGYARVFRVAAGVTATISDLTIANGRDETIGGGGIFNGGSLTVTNCTLTGNTGHIGAAIFNDSGATARITNCLLSGNFANILGGGIYNHADGTLTLTNSTVSGCRALNGAGICNYSGTMTITGSTVAFNDNFFYGAGIFNYSGTMTITGSTVSNNFTRERGGGILNSGTLTITNTSVSSNSADTFKFGAGIYNESGATVTITGSTIANNSINSGVGAGIFNGGTVTLANSTLSRNRSQYGPGLYSVGAVNITNSTLYLNTSSSFFAGISSFGSMNIRNSIAVFNTLGNGGSFSSSGVNFSTDGTYPGFTVVPASGAGGLNLGPLQDNGGPTQTHALLAGSVAIDAVTDCTDLDMNPVLTDQRGIARPIDGNGDGVPFCDAGSYEAPRCTSDFTPPQIDSCPPNIVQPLPPNQCSTVITYQTPTASDLCSSATVACTPTSGAAFPKGVTTVTCTATDASGNVSSCSFTVTLNDTEPPTITCPANITQGTDIGQCSAVVSYTAPTVNDNCPDATVSCVPASGSTFPKGTTTVTCTGSDTSNNTGTCAFSVTVNDTQSPSITCPANVTAVAAQTCPISSSATVNFPAPTASDNCPGMTTVCIPPSGSIFPVGTTIVTCTATDTSGNTANCGFTVTVFSGCLQDDSNPANVVLFNAATGEYRICCGGTPYSGVGIVQVRGCTVTIQHNPADRRVLIRFDGAVGAGTALLQSPPGSIKCTITDRNTRSNTCACQ